MKRLDVSPWNLGLPLSMMMVACGPIVPIDDAGTDTDIDPTNTTNPSDPSDPTIPSTTDPYGCAEGCPAGYYCLGNACVPEPYSDTDYCVDGGCCYYDDGGCCYGGGEFGGCCYGESGCSYYDCSTQAECYGASYCTDWGECTPASSPPECGGDSYYDTQVVPLLPERVVVSLSFVELDGDPARELVVGTTAGAGVTAVDAVTATALPVGTGANDVGGGDLDGDGDIDIVVATNAGQLAVFSNDGAGAFVAGPVDDANALRIEAGDIDGDGLVDLVGLLDFGAPTPQLSIMRALGGGEFDAPYVHAPNGPTYDFEIGELFGDVGAELSAFDGNYTSIWSGGPLDGSVDYLVGSEGGLQGAIAVGDFDGDGLGDVAQIVNVPGWTILDLWHGYGAGFERSAPQALGGTFDRAEAADLDGDGRTDLVLAGSEGVFVVLEGTAWDYPTPFECMTGYVSGIGGPAILALGDYDGDGSPDIALSDGTTTVVRVRAQGG